jgi:hypothetical protein
MNTENLPAQAIARTERTESARAIAEVQAAITVAQARPRDEARAMDQMKRSCDRPAVAQRAFYRFSRGGESITGPTIQIAMELARCWGNMNYGVRELRRGEGESEMLAFAWDLEANMRADISFIVPHERSKKSGKTALSDPRDIYENNANNAARRLREMIFRVLPPWFREEAVNACHKALEVGEEGERDKPMPVRISTMLDAFAKIGINRDRIEARLGMKADTMTPVDLASLGIIYRSLQRGETTKEIEFPTATAADVARQLAEEGGNELAQTAEGG